MEEEREELSTSTKVAIGAAAVCVWWYIRSVRKIVKEERKNRRAIEEWKDLNISAIKASTKRLTDLLNNPSTDSAAFWKAYTEEQEFLNLINDQPMY